jgi:hypothetical protein
LSSVNSMKTKEIQKEVYIVSTTLPSSPRFYVYTKKMAEELEKKLTKAYGSALVIKEDKNDRA